MGSCSKDACKCNIINNEVADKLAYCFSITTFITCCQDAHKITPENLITSLEMIMFTAKLLLFLNSVDSGTKAGEVKLCQHDKIFCLDNIIEFIEEMKKKYSLSNIPSYQEVYQEKN